MPVSTKGNIVCTIGKEIIQSASFVVAVWCKNYITYIMCSVLVNVFYLDTATSFLITIDPIGKTSRLLYD